jgi:hypothetical protein
MTKDSAHSAHTSSEPTPNRLDILANVLTGRPSDARPASPDVVEDPLVAVLGEQKEAARSRGDFCRVVACSAL